jgi:Zn-dependent peptidase ImmA (M78 family)/transcriptional regulator with XRE-family HTH domain
VSTSAYLTPEVLRWARESLGYSIEAAAHRIGVRPEKLEAAEDGEEHITLRQAEKAAKVYDRPLAALFLPEPPVEEPQEQQFRRLPGSPEPPWPPEMQLLARRVQERQGAAAELYDTLDERPPWLDTLEVLTAAETGVPDVMRHELGISLAEQCGCRDYTGYTPLRRWTDAVEDLGILVLQDGTMPVELMRGFAATHPQVPAIVVNARDDARARAFTIIHELGHLYQAALGRPVGPGTEAWADEFAGSVLMPRDEFAAALARQRGRRPLQAIDSVALEFGVTPHAAAVRAAMTEIWPQQRVDEVIDEIRRRGPRTQGTGGNYYLTQLGRLSPAFTRLVFTALDSQAVSSPAASSMLGTKVSNFSGLRDVLDRRAAA